MLISVTRAVLLVASAHAYDWHYGREPGERQKAVLERQVVEVSADGRVEKPAATFVIAAGSFWGVELAFARMPGVISTEVGFVGGSTPNPGCTYGRGTRDIPTLPLSTVVRSIPIHALSADKEVSRGFTDHAEAVRVQYDSASLSLSDLLDVFFDVHDPTQLNRQGNDVGTHCESP